MSREQERTASDYDAYDQGMQACMSIFDFAGPSSGAASSSSNQQALAGPQTVDLGSIDLRKGRFQQILVVADKVVKAVSELPSVPQRASAVLAAIVDLQEKAEMACNEAGFALNVQEGQRRKRVDRSLS